MLLSRSRNLIIKGWLTRGNFLTGYNEEIVWGKRAASINKIRFNSTLPEFDVRRSDPELVRPSCPTPNKLLLLSDLDKPDAMRHQMPLILFFPSILNMKDDKEDPAKVIKKALADALVYYYPWAGRLRDRPSPAQKLAVDCTAEGVVFVEADADVCLGQLGEQSLVPPFPYLDKLLYGDFGYAVEVIGCPMITMQVTRFLCGGFTLALKFTHVMSDAAGIIQFLTAITEFARGSSVPSILPVWQRDLLNVNSCDPLHEEITKGYNHPVDAYNITVPYDLVCRTMIFNSRDMATLRGNIPEHLRGSTTSFELIAAALWRCRTIALEFGPKEEVRLAFTFNARPVFNHPLPAGYYGNAFTLAMATSQAGKIVSDDPLGCGYTYTVEQVKKAKGTTREDYKKSSIAPGLSRMLHLLVETNMCVISDVSRLGFLNLDFGWGNPTYGGPVVHTIMPHIFSCMNMFRNEKGEEVRVLPVYLPKDAVDRFDKALHNLLNKH